MRDCDVPGHALLEQKFAGLDHRFAVEARSHLAIVQRVRYRDDGHALMMGHEVADDRDVLAFGESRTREIKRLIEAVAAACSQRREAGVVLTRAMRVHHRREARRIGGDHDVF